MKSVVLLLLFFAIAHCTAIKKQGNHFSQIHLLKFALQVVQTEELVQMEFVFVQLDTQELLAVTV